MATEKWADYLISEVRYNAAETHIDSVKLHEDKGENVAAGQVASRAYVVLLLESGSTVCTIYQSSPGQWKQGAAVRTVSVEGVRYIRTDRDSTKADNLGNLPRF